ncbi:MAG: AzlD domain-containing protein [Rhodospirillales bacterium]|nr:AzlD domain-containing protein [Rhodospirillales bacterium]
MSLSLATLAAIVAMMAATYACRAGGYLLFTRIRPTPFLRSVLAYIPGGIFMSYVTPALVHGGLPSWAGAAVTVGAMVATRSLVAGIFLGTAATWAVWLLR